jgi:hypothetical protein
MTRANWDPDAPGMPDHGYKTVSAAERQLSRSGNLRCFRMRRILDRTRAPPLTSGTKFRIPEVKFE